MNSTDGRDCTDSTDGRDCTDSTDGRDCKDSTDSIERSQTMVIAGNALEIIATRIWDDEWSLCVRNIHGIRTEWCEFFETADAALAAGREALETEDIESFISTEGFDYLP